MNEKRKEPWFAVGLGVGLAFGGAACADWDNPTALAELRPETSFQIETESVETFQEVPIHVRIREGGEAIPMKRVRLEIEPAAGGTPRTFDMEPEGDGFEAHVLFFEAGEHHLHVLGMPEKHQRFREMGETEIEVGRQHREIGPYWVEMEVSPAPIFEGGTARLHFHVFELTPEGTPGAELEGLGMSAEVHDPLGGEGPAVFLNPAEPYEAVFTFPAAGTYEVHLAIEAAEGQEVEGEFELVVVAPERAEPPAGGEGGGHDHGS